MWSIKYTIACLVLWMGLTACVDESCSLRNHGEPVDVRLVITLPKPPVENMVTKAYSNRTDYSVVKDLNVLVFDKEGSALLGAYYFDEAYNGVAPQPEVIPSLALNSGNEGFGRTVISFTNMERDARYVLVANYGKLVTADRSIANVDDLKGLTQVDADGRPDVCMMYAEAVPVTYGDVVEMKAELVRTLAMVTVKLEGLADLDAGIRVAPLKIRLKNVPDRCAVSPLVRNTAGSSSVGVVANGEEVNTALWGTLSTSNPVLGGHETGAVPLFLFENCQGDGTADTEVNKNITAKPNASYLEVEANYQYLADGVVNKSGSIVYRFCLGRDVTSNYDVLRNHHYAVTLQLSGLAGALEDGHVNSSGQLVVDGDAAGVSWRVDLTLRDWGFLQDEFNFDAHACSGLIPVKGNGWNLEWVSGDVWLKFLTKGGDWKTPETSANYQQDANGNLQFYVLPWKFSEADANTPYREFTLRVRKGLEYQLVVFRQWAPIRLENGLYMERFEEEGNELAWGYNGVALTGTYNGFSYEVGGNEASGWKNTRYLWERDHTASPAAQLCMKKAGYDLTGVPGSVQPLTDADRVMYYMPSVNELEKMIGWTGDIYDPEQFHDPVKVEEDYWSVSAPQSDPLSAYYWQGGDLIETLVNYNFISLKTSKKRVRCIYRYTDI